LSFLIYGTTKAEVQGLDQFPRDQWPTALPLLFYAYHIMAGLGTWFVLLMLVSAFLLWRGRLSTSRWVLWALLLSFPLPYIANTAGWMTAELGRQPWLIYGLMRTSEGFSDTVSASNGLFTLIGFMGLYTCARPAVHRARLSRNRHPAPIRKRPRQKPLQPIEQLNCERRTMN
jgi:cytochrome bd ubiquinol oxidase subunit I